MRIVVAALQLEACLENLGWHIDDGGSQVTKESCFQMSAVEQQMLAQSGGDEPAARYARLGWTPRSIMFLLVNS